jgi:hypothetical protein
LKVAPVPYPAGGPISPGGRIVMEVALAAVDSPSAVTAPRSPEMRIKEPRQIQLRLIGAAEAGLRRLGGRVLLLRAELLLLQVKGLRRPTDGRFPYSQAIEMAARSWSAMKGGAVVASGSLVEGCERFGRAHRDPFDVWR